MQGQFLSTTTNVRKENIFSQIQVTIIFLRVKLFQLAKRYLLTSASATVFKKFVAIKAIANSALYRINTDLSTASKRVSTKISH